MTKNRRYEHRYDEIRDRAIIEWATRGAEPESLTEAELRWGLVAVTWPPAEAPPRAWAWVRLAGIPYLLDVDVVCWTDDACAVRSVLRTREIRAWVWASAVTRNPRRRVV